MSQLAPASTQSPALRAAPRAESRVPMSFESDLDELPTHRRQEMRGPAVLERHRIFSIPQWAAWLKLRTSRLPFTICRGLIQTSGQEGPAMPVHPRKDRLDPSEHDESPGAGPEDAPSGRSVEFHAGPPPICAAMAKVAGKRFLAKDAPLLPLPGCDQPVCECHYKIRADRRASARRWGEVGFKVTETRYRQPFVQRRSSSPGRRKEDV